MGIVIRIKGTNEIKGLEIIDPESGMDWTLDCIGNCGDLEYNEDTEEYEMNQDCFDWWNEYLEAKQNSDNAIFEYRNNLDNDKIENFDADIEYAINQVNEMSDEPSAVMNVINEYN